MKFALVILETKKSKEHIQLNRPHHRALLEEWMGKMASARKLIGGDAFETEKIQPITVRLNAEGVKEVLPGPFSVGAETLGGYILIEAQSVEEAIEIAKTWPTEETIEIRPIWVP